VVAYLLVMLPWFMRSADVIGTPLPTGGTDTIWLRGYNEIANYPPGASASDFFEWGLDNILRSRWEALTTNLGTFVAVETWVILGPFALFGLWRRRSEPFLLGLMLYALGLHLAMTFVFAYPGYRGGLFHSASALLPFWAALGLLGVDETIAWAARKRRWPRAQAQAVFGGALVALAVVLSLGLTAARLDDWNNNGKFYQDVAAGLPSDAVLMVNDPPALYYHTGLSGVVVPNAEPTVIPEIAAQYGVTHLVLDVNRTSPFTDLFRGNETHPFLCHPDVSGCTYKWYDAGTADPSDDRRIFEILLPEPTP
ncbi:MAG: hypothetical protein GYB65_13135, partial [Chloroflexi bacterium]|nr:hypothetical protein [Chloroflexota bacterium]